MKPHTRLYLDTFGYDESDWIKCELPECQKQANDIHHIECRGMGGTKKPECIENLIAMCREHHVLLGDKKQHKERIMRVHLFNLSKI